MLICTRYINDGLFVVFIKSSPIRRSRKPVTKIISHWTDITKVNESNRLIRNIETTVTQATALVVVWLLGMSAAQFDISMIEWIYQKRFVQPQIKDHRNRIQCLGVVDEWSHFYFQTSYYQIAVMRSGHESRNALMALNRELESRNWQYWHMSGSPLVYSVAPLGRKDLDGRGRDCLEKPGSCIFPMYIIVYHARREICISKCKRSW